MRDAILQTANASLNKRIYRPPSDVSPEACEQMVRTKKP